MTIRKMGEFLEGSLGKKSQMRESLFLSPAASEDPRISGQEWVLLAPRPRLPPPEKAFPTLVSWPLDAINISICIYSCCIKKNKKK